MRLSREKALLGFLALLASLGCKKIDEFETLGTKVASPIDVATSDDGKYFYVLNSDFDRTYGEGSVLVINEDGEKLHATPVPRLGRNLTVVGTDMIALFDRSEDETDHSISLFDLTDPENPTLIKTWSKDDEVDCIRTLKTPRSETTLQPVRNYQRTHRALYLDAARELLFAFVTDVNKQTTTDLETADRLTFDPVTGDETPGANEVPDEYEDNKFQRKNSVKTRERYQFVVYNIGAERAKDFKFAELNDSTDDSANLELRWLYFTLKNFDGTPETDAGITDLDRKLYRTNFWDAKPDPNDPDSFYLSHRGRSTKYSRFVNSVIHVNIIGDVTYLDDQDRPTPTARVLDFKLVYGFEGELDTAKHFPGDFEIVNINGRNTLIVNHFRDLVNFRKEQHFSIAAKMLDGGFWRDEVGTSKSGSSFFQVAANARGKALSCAFYGNAVIPLEVNPGTGITVGWNDITRIK